MSLKKRAIFLDRDGVLVEDVDLLTSPTELKILPGVPEALSQLKAAGFLLLVVTNQTVVPRGLATLDEVEAINNYLNSQLGALIDDFYVCVHHPHATLPEFRSDCDCRKPNPGMLLQGAKEYDVDLSGSWMVGDRISDIIAGFRAGCRTIQLYTGLHDAPPIVSADMPEQLPEPDFSCSSLTEATEIIIR